MQHNKVETITITIPGTKTLIIHYHITEYLTITQAAQLHWEYGNLINLCHDETPCSTSGIGRYHLFTDYFDI